MKRKNFFVKVRLVIFLSLIVILFSGIYFFYLFDQKVMPSVISITEIAAQSKINDAINVAFEDSTRELGAQDFYTFGLNPSGSVESLTINTIMINNICSRVAAEISDKLANGEQEVSMPVGSIFGITALSNIGPLYKVSVVPMGTAFVDYESEFVSVGINQVNFQIWLNVNSTVRIVNPLQDKKITVSRKLALVNTVLSGKVPDVYFNSGQ